MVKIETREDYEWNKDKEFFIITIEGFEKLMSTRVLMIPIILSLFVLTIIITFVDGLEQFEHYPAYAWLIGWVGYGVTYYSVFRYKIKTFKKKNPQEFI